MSHPEAIGPYRILKHLRESGQGHIFLAEHCTPNLTESPGRLVVKSLHPHLARRPELRARFRREAEIGSRIKHPGVVRYVDRVDEQYAVAVVMVFVPGRNLTELLDSYREPGPMLALLRDLAEILDHMHRQNPPVVHLNLNPSNIRITPEGKPVLLDFSDARQDLSAFRPRSSSSSEDGPLVFTPEYAAPEQELSPKRLNGRADVYALGVLAFRLLTGSLPLPEDLSWSETFVRKAKGELNLAGAGDALDVFKEVLAPKPSARFARAGDFVAALASALLDDPDDLPAEDEEGAAPQPSQRSGPQSPVSWITGPRSPVPWLIGSRHFEPRGGRSWKLAGYFALFLALCFAFTVSFRLSLFFSPSSCPSAFAALQSDQAQLFEHLQVTEKIKIRQISSQESQMMKPL